jgi:hypothetical protein
MIPFQLFDRCGPEDYSQDLCDYNRNLTYGTVMGKVDDNYHTGDMGKGLNVSLILIIQTILNSF